MPLFSPVEGSLYDRDELVTLCQAYIHSPEFVGNVSEKEQKIGLIRSKSPGLLKFRSRGKGWGNSPLNPNCWMEVVSEGPLVEEVGDVVTDPTPEAVEGSSYNRRPWQARYRADMIRYWKVCAGTGCTTPALLTASHIKPVIYCSNEEKVDVFNGILLSKMYDKLFDAGLITFDDTGKIVFSEHVPSQDLVALGIDSEAVINLDERHRSYLQFHRDKIFKR